MNSHKIYQLPNTVYLLKSKNKFAYTHTFTYSKEIVKKYKIRLVGVSDNNIFTSTKLHINNFFKTPMKNDPNLLKSFLEDLAEEIM